MKVVFIPDYSSGNPYQKELADSLVKKGSYVAFGNTSYPFLMSKVIKRYGKPDILHIHWQHPYLIGRNPWITILKSFRFVVELLMLKVFGTKIVWTVHNIVHHEKKYHSIELFFCHFLSRICDKIIVHDKHAKLEIIRAFTITGSSKISVIPHGNYLHCYKNIVSKTEARKTLGFDTGDMVFLFIGGVRPYKGLLDLINAFKKLNDPQSKLLVAGQPINKKTADDFIVECSKDMNIRLVFEFIPANEIQFYMNAADIVVFPYRRILTSGAVILAISFGKPVIFPAIGGISEMLDNKGSLLYDNSDPNGLLEAMMRTRNCDLKKMGKHNYELAKKLDWLGIAHRTNEVYRECLGK